MEKRWEKDTKKECEKNETGDANVLVSNDTDADDGECENDRDYDREQKAN